MNPYLQIAREHLSIEDLEMLLREKRGNSAEPMTYEQSRAAYYGEQFKKLHRRKS
ncbi:hypothetical protein DSM03_10180 [Leeuwenhoekiella aestuarii]|nr:hypothetical protein DSM03_10180 [Leeuwenhoekiella aestuarii]